MNNPPIIIACPLLKSNTAMKLLIIKAIIAFIKESCDSKSGMKFVKLWKLKSCPIKYINPLITM